VLIEKVRSAVTDGTGQYRIIDLRPGTYTVTATLQGFNTVKRDGIEVTGTAVSRIDLDLQVGALEETLTITAESPIVDVQSIRRQTTGRRTGDRQSSDVAIVWSTLSADTSCERRVARCAGDAGTGRVWRPGRPRY
jgi:hypothetical protein